MSVSCIMCLFFVFVFKQKTANELRISAWSSDVCSSDLHASSSGDRAYAEHDPQGRHALVDPFHGRQVRAVTHHHPPDLGRVRPAAAPVRDIQAVHRSAICRQGAGHRSEEHTSELQSLMRISYAVFRLKKKRTKYNK